MNDELTLIVVKTEQIIESINTLLQAYDKWKDLSENIEGGRLYGCLLETKLLAEEYQKSQIIEHLNQNEKVSI